ncbi:NAD(P)H-binding protein [Nocardia sp. 2]|uniref:NAD(P)H-binding protein n=1 Tax=Nocardia acididurans TaxID=2802282 RepID=A0ABS1M7L9_9NOCA|nr:NAD(P)H-binding protein [Nocardia acididurans]MBL1076625.1 NAD(P)H-binding protein [Nocardia acididurans]
MIVVTGATGNIGRTLVQTLADAGEKVVAVSRRAENAVLPEGVSHRSADLADPDQLGSAVAGADALFLMFTGPQLVEGPDPAEYFAHAKRAGVRRVVLLSSQAAGTRPELGSHSRSRAFEVAAEESGLEWTALRPSGFFSNTYAWADPVRQQGTIFSPFGDIALPAIDPADIAAVAAAALREDGHNGRVYELTGPAPIAPRAQARIVAEALDKPVRFVELTREQARENLLRFMPPAVADGTLDIIGAPLPAELAVSPAVELLTGRAPASYAQWVERNIAAFR